MRRRPHREDSRHVLVRQSQDPTDALDAICARPSGEQVLQPHRLGPVHTDRVESREFFQMVRGGRRHDDRSAWSQDTGKLVRVAWREHADGQINGRIAQRDLLPDIAAHSSDSVVRSCGSTRGGTRNVHSYADCSLQLSEHTDEMVSGPGTGVQDDC